MRFCWSCKAWCAHPCRWDAAPSKWPLLLLWKTRNSHGQMFDRWSWRKEEVGLATPFHNYDLLLLSAHPGVTQRGWQDVTVNTHKLTGSLVDPDSKLCWRKCTARASSATRQPPTPPARSSSRRLSSTCNTSSSSRTGTRRPPWGWWAHHPSHRLPFCLTGICPSRLAGLLPVCVWERESVCVSERGRECVCERERVCVCVCVWERERESVCVCERERVCVRERLCECVWERVCVCVCVCSWVCGTGRERV